ncbi:MAG TPA: glycine oxidase ThiO [Longimicrobiales bacterium]
MGARATDVIIVGGGAIGCAVAWELATRGVSVTVIERDVPGRAATWAAGGMLSPLAEADAAGPFLDIALASLERYPAFIAALEEAAGLSVDYRTEGKLLAALDESHAERLRRICAWQRESGFAVEWLDPPDVLALEPRIAVTVCGGVSLPHDHCVDNRRLGRALWLAAARAGVRFRIGDAAAAIVTAPAGAYAAGTAAGVRLADGEVLAGGHVIIAAGAWSGRIEGLPRPLPVHPVRGQMAAVRVVPPVLRRVVETAGCYLIPRSSGDLVIGSTMERVGYRQHTTPGGLGGILAAAVAALPSLADAPITEQWAGLRPGTPDGLPILGPDPELRGLSYATGHFRNGILLTPITAALLADVLTGTAPALSLDPFSVERFAPSHAS